MSEWLKLIVLVVLIVGIGWFLHFYCSTVWEILDSIVEANAKERKAKKSRQPDEYRSCDECGSGPWHFEWDPASRTRKSRKFYCPNCTGAD